MFLKSLVKDGYDISTNERTIIMTKLSRKLSAGAAITGTAILGLAGVASANDLHSAYGQGLSYTGPHAFSSLLGSDNNHVSSSNSNYVMANSYNSQHANSGSSSSDGNTVGGLFGGNLFGFLTSGHDSGHNGSGHAVNSHRANNNISFGNINSLPFLNGGSGQGGGSIGLTGPHSTNIIRNSSSNSYNSSNNNTVSVNNNNSQSANSGRSSNDGNTIAGFGGGSGNAVNANHTTTHLGLLNATSGRAGNGGHAGGVSMGSIYLTGPHSTNLVSSNQSSSTNVSNNNNVGVNNNSAQNASSGSSSSDGNTIGGGGSTGNAGNSNATATSLMLGNVTTLPTRTSTYGAGGFIGLTGPHSTNIVDSSSSNSTNTADQFIDLYY